MVNFDLLRLTRFSIFGNSSRVDGGSYHCLVFCLFLVTVCVKFGKVKNQGAGGGYFNILHFVKFVGGGEPPDEVR